ncbi:MAG: cysteine desulfurase-like protein [Bacteroidota bacterium]
MKKLNTTVVRSHFPALAGTWAFFDNAGGAQVPKQVGDKILDYLYTTNVQHGASYKISVEGGNRVARAQKLWAKAINANEGSEIVFGSSATALLQNLSRSMAQQLVPGDEIIVTNCDHESNIGPWNSLKKHGIVIKEWKVNPHNYILEIDELAKLITNQTKLVAFTHVSNILGSINPVKEITKFVHDNGAKVCVDGVAYAPHRLIDVQDWDVDYYVFSLYKVYGPHYSILFGKKQLLNELPGINHYFIGLDEVPYKLQPGNVNYELTYGSEGIINYFEDIYNQHFDDTSKPLYSQLVDIFDLISIHEEELSNTLIKFLNTKDNVIIIGENTSNKEVRVPTISFIVKNIKSSSIPILVDPHNIAIRWGDFYARRLIEDLGLSELDGVIRISMIHYNTLEEVASLIKVLDEIL